MAGYRERLFDLSESLGLENYLLRTARRIPGIEPPDVRSFVDREIRAFDHTSGTNGVVLVPLFPAFVQNMVILCTLAHAFRTRGYDVVLIGCDDEIPVCSRDSVDMERSTRTYCQFSSRQVCSAFGLTFRSAGDVLPDGYSVDLPEAALSPDGGDSVEYGGVNISGLARSSVRKYHRAYNVDIDDGQARENYIEYLRTAAKMADVSRAIIRDEDVVAVLAFDDNYVYGGAPLRVAADAGIPACSVDVGYVPRSLIFGNMKSRNSLPMFTDTDTLETILSEPLSREEKLEVTELMDRRARGSEGRYLYSPQTDVSVDSTDGRLLVGMFTNLSWDASLTVDGAAFSNMFEWIRTTVDALGGREDVDLVVRTHPAEAARDTKESVAEWIETNLGPCPPNVTVLKADSEVNTYNLISEMDVGLVYASIVGLESVLRRVPTVVAGDTHYRGLGFTRDPETEAEYVELLETLGELTVSDRGLERAERYAHFFFFRKHVDFPFFDENSDNEDLPFTGIRHDRIEPGNQEFDRLIEQMVNDEPVYTGQI